MNKVKLVLAFSLFSAALVAGCVSPPTRMSVENIIANNALAMHVTSETRPHDLQVDLSMKDGDSEFDAVYYVARDGRMRIDILRGGRRIYTEAYDGTQGWDIDENGKATVDPNGAALWHGTQFPEQVFTLGDLSAKGHRVDYAGREDIAGVNYYVLKITLSDGFQTYRYINPKTWLIERGRDFRAFHPAVDDKRKWIETVWSDYRPINGGILHPFLSTNIDLSNGKWLATNTVKSIKVDPNFDVSAFTQQSSPRN